MAGGAVSAAGSRVAEYTGGATWYVLLVALIGGSSGLLFGFDNASALTVWLFFFRSRELCGLSPFVLAFSFPRASPRPARKRPRAPPLRGQARRARERIGAAARAARAGARQPRLRFLGGSPPPPPGGAGGRRVAIGRAAAAAGRRLAPPTPRLSIRRRRPPFFLSLTPLVSPSPLIRHHDHPTLQQGVAGGVVEMPAFKNQFFPVRLVCRRLTRPSPASKKKTAAAAAAAAAAAFARKRPSLPRTRGFSARRSIPSPFFRPTHSKKRRTQAHNPPPPANTPPNP